MRCAARTAHSLSPLVVLTEPLNVYLTYYGTWNESTNDRAPVLNSVLPLLISGLAGSTYWSTVTSSYFNASGAPSTSAMQFGGSVMLDASKTLGSALFTPSDIVKYTFSTGIFNASTNAIYLLLTTSDVSFVMSSLSTACGYHDSFMRFGVSIKYAVVGDLIGGCNYGHTSLATGTVGNVLANNSLSPNGNYVADSMITTIIHELAETVTDPEAGTGWMYSGNASKTLNRYTAAKMASKTLAVKHGDKTGAVRNSAKGVGNSALKMMNKFANKLANKGTAVKTVRTHLNQLDTSLSLCTPAGEQGNCKQAGK